MLNARTFSWMAAGLIAATSFAAKADDPTPEPPAPLLSKTRAEVVSEVLAEEHTPNHNRYPFPYSSTWAQAPNTSMMGAGPMHTTMQRTRPLFANHCMKQNIVSPECEAGLRPYAR